MAKPVVVILAEDASGLRRALRFLLLSEHFEVRTVHGVDDLLEAPAPCACIVMKQRFGGNDGLRVAAELRARGSQTPIIIVTPLPSTELKAQAAELGVQVLETLRVAQLLPKAIREALDKAGAPGAGG